MPARAAKERWAVAVTSIAKQCLANRPEDRPQSPAQVASALAAAIGIAAGQLKGAAGTMWDPVGALVGAERHAARREEKRAAIDRKSQRLWAIVIGAAVLAGALLGLALQHVGR